MYVIAPIVEKTVWLCSVYGKELPGQYSLDVCGTARQPVCMSCFLSGNEPGDIISLDDIREEIKDIKSRLAEIVNDIAELEGEQIELENELYEYQRKLKEAEEKGSE